MADSTKKLVARAKKVSFLGVKGSTSTEAFTRMTNFTTLSKSSNPNEYSRQYVDEESEQTDIVGYSPSWSYSFDQYTNNAVHKEIIDITDEEKTGTDAVRNIVTVDFSNPVAGSEGAYVARSRPFAVIPDSEGDKTEAYTYSGNFKCKGEQVLGKATTADNWQTCTFVADSDAEA